MRLVDIDTRLREVRTNWEEGRKSRLESPSVYPFPEPERDVAARMRACISDLVVRAVPPGEAPVRVLAVSHDAAILICLTSLLGLRWGQLPILIPLTSVSVIAVKGATTVVRSIADATHLAAMSGSDGTLGTRSAK
jgi:probable phosphoglycerate mutase